VVVWRLDRLGRTAKGLTALFEELIQRNVNLVTLRESFDLMTPAGRLMAVVLSGVTQYETEVRAERVLAGQAVARANGNRWGGSKEGAAAQSNGRATGDDHAVEDRFARGWRQRHRSITSCRRMRRAVKSSLNGTPTPLRQAMVLQPAIVSERLFVFYRSKVRKSNADDVL
jgi:DNA invertase Pin-like site-specific DNA recombinase